MGRLLILLAAVSATIVCTLAPAPARGAPDPIPVDVALGPAFYYINGAMAEDQPVHFGLSFDVAAVLDRKAIKANKWRIPAKYHKTAEKFEEVRYSPSIFIPDNFFISPRLKNTAMFGITWRSPSVGLIVTPGRRRLTARAGLVATYAYISSTTLPSPTHFLRPGLRVQLNFEQPLTRRILTSVGWASDIYVPQALGSFGFGEIHDSIWHMGHAYVRLHYRFNYRQ
jgi:hypothetical protein